MKRYGYVIILHLERVSEYVRLHAAVWPEVLKMIRACHIRNYPIYLRKLADGQHYLFNYFEYTGGDFAADMAKIAADPATQKWGSVCKPCHEPPADRALDEWWANMDEVFHLD
jgi:L-rhamnose mutarotase